MSYLVADASESAVLGHANSVAAKFLRRSRAAIVGTLRAVDAIVIGGTVTPKKVTFINERR